MNLSIERLSKQYRRDFWGLREFDINREKEPTNRREASHV